MMSGTWMARRVMAERLFRVTRCLVLTLYTALHSLREWIRVATATSSMCAGSGKRADGYRFYRFSCLQVVWLYSCLIAIYRSLDKIYAIWLFLDGEDVWVLEGQIRAMSFQLANEKMGLSTRIGCITEIEGCYNFVGWKFFISFETFWMADLSNVWFSMFENVWILFSVVFYWKTLFSDTKISLNIILFQKWYLCDIFTFIHELKYLYLKSTHIVTTKFEKL